MVCGGCGLFLTPIRFDSGGGSNTAIVRCVFCKWRSTWLEDVPKGPAPAPKAPPKPKPVAADMTAEQIIAGTKSKPARRK